MPATTSARYVVVHDEGSDLVQLDQSAAEGGWAVLGTYRFGKREGVMVELLGITNDAERAVRFDAIKWLPLATGPDDQTHASARNEAEAAAQRQPE